MINKKETDKKIKICDYCGKEIERKQKFIVCTNGVNDIVKYHRECYKKALENNKR